MESEIISGDFLAFLLLSDRWLRLSLEKLPLEHKFLSGRCVKLEGSEIMLISKFLADLRRNGVGK